MRQENVAPYEWSASDSLLNDMAAGSYNLRAVATDNGGQSGENTISISVGGGSGPGGGFVYYADEGSGIWVENKDLAYGANGSFNYIYNAWGWYVFDNATFGGDPAPGSAKKGYVRD